MALRAFNPQAGANQIVTAGVASAEISINPQSLSVRVVNTSANIAHVRLGTSNMTVQATTADTPILGNSEIILTKAFGQDVLAYIRGAGSDSTLQIQTGQGGV